MPTSPYRPPTIRAFRAMSLKRRGQAMLHWLATQKPLTRFYSGDINDCILARFGNAIARGKVKVSAGTFYIWFDDADEVVPVWGDRVTGLIWQRTYGAFAKRLKAHLEDAS